MDRFAQHLRASGIAVDTHNRKIRRIRKIFSILNDFREGGNPFQSNILFRQEREEQNFAVRHLAFTREQEQHLREVLDNDRFHMINKPEVRVVYCLGMYTVPHEDNFLILLPSDSPFHDSLNLSYFINGSNIISRLCF